MWYWIEFYRSYRKRTGKMRPFIEAIRPLIPFVSLFIITTIWVLFSKNSIANKEPRLYLLLLGTIFSNISVMFLKWNLILDVIRIFLKNDFFLSFGSVVWLWLRCRIRDQMRGTTWYGWSWLSPVFQLHPSTRLAFQH